MAHQIWKSHDPRSIVLTFIIGAAVGFFIGRLVG